MSNQENEQTFATQNEMTESPKDNKSKKEKSKKFDGFKNMSKTKKIVMLVTAIALVLAIGIGAFLGVYLTTVPKDMQYKVQTVNAKSQDKVKVGILSDTQLPQVEKHLYGWDYATIMNGGAHLIKALNYFKTQDIDMLVFNGDMANSVGDYAAFSAYNKILDYVYGKDRKDMPHIIYPMGNHEFYGANQEYLFYKATGLPLNTRTIINGYSFISVSNSRLEKGDAELAQSNGTLADGTYNPKRIAFLKEQMQAAATEDPDKPIFVFLHMPIDPSINGGHWATPQYEEIYNVIKQYPQAVVMTGHSHYCLSDERAIVQKDFTMVNTGTTSYFDFDWLKDDVVKEIPMDQLLSGKHDKLKNKDYLINPQMIGINKSDDVPFRSDVNNGLILEIDVAKKSFTLDKINFTTATKFGERFEMSKYTKESFTRTETQLKSKAIPVMDNTENFSIKTEGKIVNVKFNSSSNPVIPVKYYQYEILNKQTQETTYVRFFAKNYILGYDVPSIEMNNIYGLNAGNYTLTIKAIDSYNRVSETSIQKDFTIL